MGYFSLKWSLIIKSLLQLNNKVISLFVLFVFFVTHKETSQLMVKGCKLILTYNALHLWPTSVLLSMPHLLWHGTSVYKLFIKVISQNPWLSHLLPSIGGGAVTTYIKDLGLSQQGLKHQTFRLQGDCSNRLHHRRDLSYMKKFVSSNNFLKNKRPFREPGYHSSEK